MKLTVTFYLLAMGTLLFFSCTKDNDINTPCENCIIVAQDSLQNQDKTAAIPIAVIAGTQANISLAASGSFPGSEFTISIGNSGDLLSEHINLDGQTLSWDFNNLSSGTYPVRINQTN